MHWGQIKTLFILCFLLLDIYLLLLVMEKQEEADIAVIERPDELSTEQQLESENITIQTDLPESPSDEAFMTIRQKRITEEDVVLLNNLENQELIVANNFIISRFDEPITIPDDADLETIQSLIDSYFIYSSDYELNTWNRELNILVFFQKKNDRPVYYNQNGMVLVYLNEDNEMVAYTQTILGEPEVRNDKRPLIEPIMALETLYDNYQLLPGEEVTDVEMGYHMMLPLDNGVHVLVPTWKVTINEEKKRYINAVERRIYEVNDNDILIETIETSIDRVRAIDEEIEFETDMLQLLDEKLEVFESE